MQTFNRENCKTLLKEIKGTKLTYAIILVYKELVS